MISESKRQYISTYLAPIPEAEAYHDKPVGEFDSREIALQLHLIDPSISATDLTETTGMKLDEIMELYIGMQTDENIKAITASLYYPRRMMARFAEATVRDWIGEPEYAEQLLGGRPVVARDLEVHATRGSCDYTCTMCLWSDKEETTYTNLGLEGFGLMDFSDWIKVFQSAQSLGAQRIIFSGGGEPMLNKDLFSLSAAARNIGLRTQLYSNGYGFKRVVKEEDWGEILQMEQVRFSVHSPTANIYNKIVNMPEQTNALPTVMANIRELLARREASGGNVQVGIGFVAQSLNHSQIEAMVDFAKDIGVDFINLRQDEVAVTRELDIKERNSVAMQLSSVRSRVLGGEFGTMKVDMSDDMTALANGIEQSSRRVTSCFAKLFRPAISPFGIVAPCDLRAEPRFSHPDYVLGSVKKQTLPIIVENVAQKKIDAECAQCMPSGRTINAIVTKFILDSEAGIHYTQQPFNNKLAT